VDVEMKKIVGKLQQLKVSFDQKRLEIQRTPKRLAEKQQTGIVTVSSGSSRACRSSSERKS